MYRGSNLPLLPSTQRSPNDGLSSKLSIGRLCAMSANASTIVRGGVALGAVVLISLSLVLVQHKQGNLHVTTSTSASDDVAAGPAAGYERSEGGVVEEARANPPDAITSPHSQPLSPLKSKCSDACFEHGTCNEERGECFCLPPWGGRDCNEYALPSCMLSDKIWSVCKDVTTCECIFECDKLALTINNQCFKGVSANGSRVTDLNTLFLGPRYPVMYRSDMEALESVEKWYKMPPDTSPSKQTNPEECPGTCGGKSMCGRENKDCYCSWATQGAECEITPSGLRVPCFNGCSGKGECVYGSCKCERGFFGLDCSLFLDSQGITQIVERPPYNWTEAVKWPPKDPSLRPRIYVYDLPPYFNTWMGLYSNFLDWAEPIWFMERIHNSPYRTADPEQADFFFLPLFVRNRGGNNRARVVSLAKNYIKKTYPYFNKSGGSDHFILTNSDWGNCEMGGMWGHMFGEMHPVLDDIFTLTTWGCSTNMHLEEKRPCFRPGRDVVIPPDQDVAVFKFAPGYTLTPPEPPFDNRTILLYFRGYSAEDSGPWGRGNYTWSFNVRQEMFGLYRNKNNDTVNRTTGIVLETMESGPWDYWHLRQMLRSVFCLGPAGWGWGMRAPQVVLMGCIPVVIQPKTYQAFEGDGLNWEEFGVRLEKKDIPNIQKILEAIPPEEIKKKQEALVRVKSQFVWSSTNYNPLQFLPQDEQDKRAGALLESDAFVGVMEALRERLKKQGKL